MPQKFQLTQEGIDEIKAERDRLLVRRDELAKSIAVAREQGDLSENSEYQISKEEQNKNENRLGEIENILRNTVTIERPSGRGQVSLGSTVDLLESATGKKSTFSLVGSLEADPLVGKISDESPLGQALVGQSVGQDVVVQGPELTMTYTIKAIG